MVIEDVRDNIYTISSNLRSNNEKEVYFFRETILYVVSRHKNRCWYTTIKLNEKRGYGQSGVTILPFILITYQMRYNRNSLNATHWRIVNHIGGHNEKHFHF